MRRCQVLQFKSCVDKGCTPTGDTASLLNLLNDNKMTPDRHEQQPM